MNNPVFRVKTGRADSWSSPLRQALSTARRAPAPWQGWEWDGPCLSTPSDQSTGPNGTVSKLLPSVRSSTKGFAVAGTLQQHLARLAVKHSIHQHRGFGRHPSHAYRVGRAGRPTARLAVSGWPAAMSAGIKILPRPGRGGENRRRIPSSPIDQGQIRIVGARHP